MGFENVAFSDKAGVLTQRSAPAIAFQMKS